MAVLLSDTFDGMSAEAALDGRTLDNGLGGSGTRTWVKAAGIASTNVSDGVGGAKRNNSSTELQGTDVGGEQNGIVRFRFNCTASLNVNLVAFGKGSQPAPTQGTASVYAMLITFNTTNALRIRNQNSTDLAQATIAGLSTNTVYYMELEVNSASVTARIRNSDLSIRNTVSYTYASGSPFGNYWGFGSITNSDETWFADDFLFTDLDGVPSTPSVSGIKGSVFRSSVFHSAVLGGNGVFG